MPRKVIIDSGPLVALFDRSDHYHQTAVDFLKTFKGSFYSTTAVLTEVCYLLDFSVDVQIDFLTWIQHGAIQIIEITQGDLNRIIELTQKYSDLPMDFADSTLVAIGERLNISQIATVDRDFYVYRLRKKEAFENIFLTLN